jgi:hypothetical protein
MGYAEYGLGQAYFVGGRYREAKTFLDRASARLTTAPENVPPGTTGSSVLVLCHMMKTMVHAVMGEYDDSLQCSRLASALAEKNDLPYDLIAADYGRGFMQMSHGNLDEAVGLGVQPGADPEHVEMTFMHELGHHASTLAGTAGGFFGRQSPSRRGAEEARADDFAHQYHVRDPEASGPDTRAGHSYEGQATELTSSRFQAAYQAHRTTRLGPQFQERPF